MASYEQSALLEHYHAMKKERRLQEFDVQLRQMLKENRSDLGVFSLRDLWDGLVPYGRDIRESWTPSRGGFTRMREAVDSSAFANITGQIYYNAILEQYEDPLYIGDQLCTTVKTDLNGEKIAGITPIGNDADLISEAEQYPEVGLSEKYVETPQTEKRGRIVSVTKEAIFFDRTQQLLDMASDVGRAIRISKERRIISVATGTTNNYKYNGTAIDTYGNSSGSHDWDNLSASTALQDWTDVDAALQLLFAITDPDTGEPIMLNPDAILIPPALQDTAHRIMNATETRVVTNTSNTTLAPKPNANYAVLSNQYVKVITTSDSTWYLGNFKKAFRYMENWDMTVTSQNEQSGASFDRDIIARFKASERGVCAVVEPRCVVKCTA